MPKLMYDDKNYSGNASSSGGGVFPHLIVISETGSTVTATKGSTTITARETSTDHFECDLVTSNPQDTYGTWLIHAILNGDDAQASLVVDAVKVYTVDDEHFHADIIVTYPDGAVVSCTKDGLSPMYATSSPYTFTVHSIGMYTISGEKDGITETVEADITTNGQTINITLDLLPDGKTVTPTDDVQTLLLCAGIDDKPYTTISALIADDTTLLKVITYNNAIDYLVRSTTFASAITADSDAMAMIGSYDYASDTLLDGETWEDNILNTANANLVYNVNVPPMTSASTPKGNTFATTADTSLGNHWNAFDGNLNTRWVPTNSGATDRIGYKFAKTQKIRAFQLQKYVSPSFTSYIYTCKVQKSNDGGSTFSDITTAQSYHLLGDAVGQFITEKFAEVEAQTFGFLITAPSNSRESVGWVQFFGRENGGVQSWLRAGGITDKSYTTLAEVLADTTTLSTLIASHDAVDYLVTAKAFIDGIVADATAMSYIGLNNYCANTLLADAEWLSGIANSTYKETVLNAKNPTMTGTNTPSGTVSTDGYYGNYYPWYAFDGDDNGSWASRSSPALSNYLQYTFDDDGIIPKVLSVYIGTNSYPTYKLQGSNDGTTWTDLYSGSLQYGVIPISNSTRYKHLRFIPTSVAGQYSGTVMKLLFYGREDL